MQIIDMFLAPFFDQRFFFSYFDYVSVCQSCMFAFFLENSILGIDRYQSEFLCEIAIG